MNNKPISKTILEENNIDQDFIDSLTSKLTDANHINCALRMFIDGKLPLDHINNAEKIDLPVIRKQIADAIRERRSAWSKHLEEQRRLSEYYSSCKMVRSQGKIGNHFVFIKDGHIVAFGLQTPKEGGIYAANNPVQGVFNWNPNEHLARIRKLDKQYYKRIKNAAFADDRAIFDMNQTTIKNK